MYYSALECMSPFMRTVPSAPYMSRTLLILGAYEEYKVTRQVSTGQGDWLGHELTAEPSSLVNAKWGPSSAFVSGELGFGDPKGPSLEQTVARLPETNRRNIESLMKRAIAPTYSPPPKAGRKRESKYTRKAKREQALLRGLIAQAA